VRERGEIVGGWAGEDGDHSVTSRSRTWGRPKEGQEQQQETTATTIRAEAKDSRAMATIEEEQNQQRH